MDETNLTHVDAGGAARMVDVSGKDTTRRLATARATVRMQPQTLERIVDGGHHKGDVFAVARIAGIQASKRTSDLIPLCHPLPIDSVEVDLAADFEASAVRIEATVGVVGRTGVEMEALSAAAVAALTVYDMCKAVDRGMCIEDLRLMRKSGGRSGDWEAD